MVEQLKNDGQKEILKNTIESLYSNVKNEQLRDFLLKNNYATEIDLEDEEYKDLQVALIIQENSEQVFQYIKKRGESCWVQKCEFMIVEVDKRNIHLLKKELYQEE